MQATEPKPQLNGEQLIQMIFTVWKQTERQLTEMIQLCEAAALEKEATACV